jgi:hypothetical protein
MYKAKEIFISCLNKFLEILEKLICSLSFY